MLTTAPEETGSNLRRVAVLAFDDAQILDVTGPIEILTSASERTDTPAYEVSLVGAHRPHLTTTCGLKLSIDKAIDDYTNDDFAALDTLVVAGGAGMRRNAADPQIMRFVRHAAAHARRITSVCTGAFVLAAAGLLDGRRAVTHWMFCNTLERNFPHITVDPDAIYVRDGKIWTSAGVTAGMDLALALVEDDLGRDLALQIAREKVMFMMRPGGQSQYSSHLAAQQSHDAPFADLLRWIVENVDRDLSVPELAHQAAMSERNFARRFAEQTGTTPARFVEAARVQAARRSLEDVDAPMPHIARQSGFANAERMRRAFHRHLGISPQEYRDRFGRAPAQRVETLGEQT